MLSTILVLWGLLKFEMLPSIALKTACVLNVSLAWVLERIWHTDTVIGVAVHWAGPVLNDTS